MRPAWRSRETGLRVSLICHFEGCSEILIELHQFFVKFGNVAVPRGLQASRDRLEGLVRPA